jgi:hypothetical protein
MNRASIDHVLTHRPVEQSSAPRVTLRFTLGAGVTPAARRAGDCIC